MGRRDFGAMQQYGSFVRPFIDEASGGSKLLQVIKGDNELRAVANGSYGKLLQPMWQYGSNFVVKRSLKDDHKIVYKGNVLEKLGKFKELNKYVVWSCIGNEGADVVMQYLQPLDLAIKFCPLAQLQGMRAAFQTWVRSCLKLFNENNVYLPDFQIRNLAYGSSFGNGKPLVHNYRLIDIDGLISADGFECVGDVSSAYVQFLQDADTKSLLSFRKHQFDDLDGFKRVLSAVQTYSVYLIFLVFDIRIGGDDVSKKSVRAKVANAQKALVSVLKTNLKGFGGKIVLNTPVDLQEYCKSKFKSDEFSQSIREIESDGVFTVANCNVGALQTTLKYKEQKIN